MWPRYVGIAALSLVLVGCLVLTIVGLRALGDDAGAGSDVFGLILGGVGFWYVGNELRGALGRLRAARAGELPEKAGGPAAH
jgi:hypothetical protein